MAQHTSIDHEGVKAAVARLKESKPTPTEIASDPKGFLSRQGIHISDQLEARIKAALRTHGGTTGVGRPALIIHVDGG
jgi:hypothetical protein